MTETTFFNTQTISSRVKAGIVSEYFPSYSKIIIKKFIPKAVRFIDLFQVQENMKMEMSQHHYCLHVSVTEIQF